MMLELLKLVQTRWDWKYIAINVSDIKFEKMIKLQFADRTYFSNCSPVDSTSTRPTYFGDTDGSVGAVLYALFATGTFENHG
ncbi:DUF4049 domain-containing protein [Escherichia coli]